MSKIHLNESILKGSNELKFVRNKQSNKRPARVENLKIKLLINGRKNLLLRAPDKFKKLIN